MKPFLKTFLQTTAVFLGVCILAVFFFLPIYRSDDAYVSASQKQKIKEVCRVGWCESSTAYTPFQVVTHSVINYFRQY